MDENINHLRFTSYWFYSYAAHVYIDSVIIIPNFTGAPGLYLSEGSFGILYIEHEGEYGTVCGDFFDDNNHGCNVTCRELEYE